MGFGDFGDGIGIIGDYDGGLIFPDILFELGSAGSYSFIQVITCQRCHVLLFVLLRWLRNCHCLEGLRQTVVSRVTQGVTNINLKSFKLFYHHTRS
jgi:hypothetical protein